MSLEIAADPLAFVLQRELSAHGSTIGELLVDGEHVCYTCEDVVRQAPGVPVAAWKVAGQTAIPTGLYRVVITLSARFHRPMPLLLNVPGFTGIRIHSGNVAADTDGCILVGRSHVGGELFRSRDAFTDVYALIERALLTARPVTLEIRNP